MGKVASSSIYYSLRFCYIGPVIHGHAFGPRSKHFEIRRLYKYFQKGGHLKVITLVREPVSRNISAFFQNFKRFTGKEVYEWDQHLIDLKAIFIENFHHDGPLIWFDKKIKKVFGIDIYEDEFPAEGYTSMKNGSVEILAIKHDLPNELKEKIISEFIGIKKFKINDTNAGSDKVYKDLYSAFKQEVKLPKPLLDHLTNSTYFNYFFNDMREKVYSKWCETTD